MFRLSVASNALSLGYLVAFAGAALACFAGAYRARRIGDTDTRRGLTALLVTSGTWATAHLGFLVATTSVVKHLFYEMGLIVGFATVWAWLYFCSAYTGRSLHRNRWVRRLAAAVFMGVVVAKVTNPLHHLYYTLEFTTLPFPHFTTRQHLLYWLAMGLSYALAMVGYFMLVEFFETTGSDATPLAVLSGLTALPVGLDAIGYAYPVLLDLPHEPLGVAAFAVGTLFVYTGHFRALRITEAQNAPTLVLDADDRIRNYGAAAAALFPELNRSDALGTPLETALPRLAKALAQDESPVEDRRETPPRYYRVTSTRLGAGGELGRIVTLTDVTAEERRKRTLKRRNDLFAKAQALAGVGAWEYDVRSGALSWTDEVYRIYDLPTGVEPTLDTAISFYHPDDRPTARRVLTQVIEEGEAYDVDLRLRTPSGELRWVHARGVPQMKDGEVIRVRGAIQDITEQKEREQALLDAKEEAEEASRKFRDERDRRAALIENARDPILEAQFDDGRPIIKTVNPAFEEVFGLGGEDLDGQAVATSLIPDDEREQFRRLHEQARRGEPAEAEVCRKTEDGIREFRVRLVPIEEEAPMGVYVWFTDITERKRRERELREAKTEAEEAAQLKSAMLANMSHEVRTPLTAINGFSEILKEELSGSQKALAERIHDGGNQLMHTLDSVLKLSKLEAGEFELERRSVNLGILAVDTVQMLSEQAEDQGVSLNAECPEDPVEAWAQEDALRRVVENLTENAIKFTPEDGRAVLRVREEGDAAVLEVEDTGIGVGEESQSKIFRAFKQESEGLDREYEGSGLGLAIVRRLVDALGGKIEVESEKGVGTRFTVCLPRAGIHGDGAAQHPAALVTGSLRD